MASPNVSEIVATTLRKRSQKIADNVSNNNALLMKLNQRGKVKPFNGGRTILETLSYADNSTYQRYSGYDALNIQPSDVFTAAEYDLKQVAVAVTISGLEELQNNGDAAVFDLLEERIENAEDSMANGLAADVHSDGTADGGRQIGGLELLIAEDPTSGIVGGIDRSLWSFWRNVAFDATTDGGAAASALNIQSYMNQVALQLVRGRDYADMIVAGNSYYRFYLESLQNIQRITDDKLAAAGFSTLKYYGAGNNADVVLDGGIGGNTPTDKMYFINTKYICLRPHSNRNMVPIGSERYSVNQDAMVNIVGWAGNMTLRGAKFHGVLFD